MNNFLQISDLHFGNNFFFSPSVRDPIVTDSLTNLIGELNPDFLVVTGDLTQRAREKEFLAAKTWLQAFEKPFICIPGNHDIAPYWNPMQRLFKPYLMYKQVINRPNLLRQKFGPFNFYSLTTVRATRVDRGWITVNDWKKFLALKPGKQDGIKVLLTHHPVLPPTGAKKSTYILNFEKYLDRLINWDFKLFLSGHIHFPHFETVVRNNKNAFFITCASSTSNRFRRNYPGKNMAIFYQLKNDKLLVTPFVCEKKGWQKPCPIFSPLKKFSYSL
ncbi:metallophosphoesterase family protein [Candidatus Riflebacteria bacterium]